MTYSSLGDVTLLPLLQWTQGQRATTTVALRLANIPPAVLNDLLSAANLVAVQFQGGADEEGSREALEQLSTIVEDAWCKYGSRE